MWAVMNTHTHTQMQHNKLHVLGVTDDPGGYLLDALVEVGAEIKGTPVDDSTTFSVREFRYAFELLEQVRWFDDVVCTL